MGSLRLLLSRRLSQLPVAEGLAARLLPSSNCTDS